VINTEHHQRII